MSTTFFLFFHSFKIREHNRLFSLSGIGKHPDQSPCKTLAFMIPFIAKIIHIRQSGDLFFLSVVHFTEKSPAESAGFHPDNGRVGEKPVLTGL